MALFSKSRSVVGLDIGSSAVKAVELKPAGKGAMDASAWLRGARLEIGARFGGDAVV